jgi:asparagine N-glycosylation enzyme membrane subunit Stt3
LLALINAAFPAFLVYGLNRYAYYVTPFMAGATGIFAAVLLDRIKLLSTRNIAGEPINGINKGAETVG